MEPRDSITGTASHAPYDWGSAGTDTILSPMYRPEMHMDTNKYVLLALSDNEGLPDYQLYLFVQL